MFFEIIKFYKKSNNLKNIEENLKLDDFLKARENVQIFYKLSYYSYGFCNMVYATI